MGTNNERSFETLLQGKNQIFAIIVMVLMTTLAFPPALLNFLLSLTIAMSVVVLLISIFRKEMFESTFFPGFLLAMTIVRLSMNISLAFIILSGRGMTVDIIKYFGDLTIGNDYIVGIAVFAILVLIQTVVASKGLEHIVEVTARFIIDAMPIKAMAIDADLNSGAIDQNEAATQRLNITRKVSYFSSMTGTGRLIKYDSTANAIITTILFGAVAMSLFSGNGTPGDVAQKYILLSIGAGLVIYIPALFIAVSTGLAVNQMASDTNA